MDVFGTGWLECWTIVALEATVEKILYEGCSRVFEYKLYRQVLHEKQMKRTSYGEKV